MNKDSQKFIITYFNHLDNHLNKWNDILENLKRPMVGLKNQSEQLQHVERTTLNEEETCFPDLKEKLLFKILCGIDDELLIIKNSIAELNALNQELRNKLVAFEKSTSDFDWYNEDDNSGTAIQPRLSDMLQMAYEIWKYYTDMYQCISVSYKTLNVKSGPSLKKLDNSFNINSTVKNRINYILGLTQYCNKNV